MAGISKLPSEFISRSDSQGRPWDSSFAVIGDFGNVSALKSNLATEKSPVNYVGEAIRRMSPDFILSLGDDNYMEGKREWKDFNTGKNFAPYIYPYTLLNVNSNNDEARKIASPDYLSDQVPRKPWNRFFTAPGNHEVGMTGGKGLLQASGRRDWSHDKYYKAAFEHSHQWGSLTPLAESYVKPGDILYHDYSYGTSWNISTFFKEKEGAMNDEYYDYLLNPVDSDGIVLSELANIYMVDRNNTAYGESNPAYKAWRRKNPLPVLDPQAAFLMREARKRDQDVPWQIFASHYQTHSSESSLPGMQLPFFENGIDLVLGAHVHNYERIRAADTAGVVGDYIVNGVGGYNTSYRLGVDFGADEIFPSIGTVSGYQAGSTGGWGFGWIDLNSNELLYRQFQADFTLVENPSLVGIQDAYWGVEPIADVKITLVDSLRLEASPSSTFDNELDIASDVEGSMRNEHLIGSKILDRILGFAGKDRIDGRGGNDFINAGNGKDRIDGGRGDDSINGGNGEDRIHGGRGDDSINGGNGKDRIHGGRGGDSINGGKSADRIIYHTPDESSPGQFDTVSFSKNDKFDFRFFDSDGLTNDRQPLRYIANNDFSGAVGELRFTGRTLEADTTGNAQADFMVVLDTPTPSFSATNLLL